MKLSLSTCKWKRTMPGIMGNQFLGVTGETSQIGYTSHTWTRKSRFAYKWDWSSRH